MKSEEELFTEEEKVNTSHEASKAWQKGKGGRSWLRDQLNRKSIWHEAIKNLSKQ